MNPRMRFVLAAIASGAAASFAMDAVQWGIAGFFERGRALGERDEEVEAIESVVRLLGTVVPAVANGRRSHDTARVLHYAFGIAFAGAYVVVARRMPLVASGNGVAFGTALFLATDRIAIPALGLGRAWRAYSQSERFNALASHVTYGVVLETLRSRFVRPCDDAR